MGGGGEVKGGAVQTPLKGRAFVRVEQTALQAVRLP